MTHGDAYTEDRTLPLGKLQSLGTVTAIDWSAYAAIVTPPVNTQARD